MIHMYLINIYHFMLLVIIETQYYAYNNYSNIIHIYDHISLHYHLYYSCLININHKNTYAYDLYSSHEYLSFDAIYNNSYSILYIQQLFKPNILPYIIYGIST